MKRIAIYSRKSRFTGKGDSIENQIEMCKEHIKKFVSTDVEFFIYEDEGFSGGNINRPAFKRLINDIKYGNINLLICYRLDRISRNVADFSSVLDILQEYKVDFISIKEQFDTSSPMGRAMIYIASVFAQLERETIAERIKDNMLEMAKKGKWTGGKLPLGFTSKKTAYIDEEGKKRFKVSLIHDNKDLEFVKFLYEKYLELGSLHKLETYTHENNIRSASGKIFEKSTLKIILQNPIYVKADENVFNYFENKGWSVYGEPDGIHSLLSYNKTETAKKDGKLTKRNKDESESLVAVSNIEGYIDSSLWLKVQYQFKKNKDTFPRLGKTHNALLVGKLFCGNCGTRMIIQHGRTSSKTGIKNFYYVCSLKKTSKKKLCKAHNVKTDFLENLVLDALEKLYDKKEYISDSLKINLKQNKNTIEEINNTKKLIEIKNTKLSTLVEKLSLDFDNLISDILIPEMKKLKLEINDLESKLEDLKLKKQESEMNKIEIDLITSLLNKCKNIKELDRIEQKQIIDCLIDSIYYYSNDNGNDKIKIKFINDIDSISTVLSDEEKRQFEKLSFYSHSMSSI
ncbi:TPA: recombinase family protein [Clostridium perfringens]|nr:recombinase family protein [Clostridium perfringens]HBC2032322.1 recombinase family protein [Clostridium perfringens]HBC2056057.1 recombinase family protein [Clostridium perfringens]HBC2069672.1 recombinase family protein [Clostridium perfringens]